MLTFLYLFLHIRKLSMYVVQSRQENPFLKIKREMSSSVVICPRLPGVKTGIPYGMCKLDKISDLGTMSSGYAQTVNTIFAPTNALTGSIAVMPKLNDSSTISIWLYILHATIILTSTSRLTWLTIHRSFGSFRSIYDFTLCARSDRAGHFVYVSSRSS